MAFTSKMKRESKPRSGIALGGIGTGGIELRQDGIFRNWHIFNNTPFGTADKIPFAEDSLLFFVVRYQVEGGNPKMKVLQIEEGYEVAAVKSQPHYYIFPWLSGVDEIEYSASYPFVKLKFSDAEMPFDVYLEAFSPMIPHDVKNSSLPGIIFNFEIKSKTDKSVDVMLMASMRNTVGYNIIEKRYVSTVASGTEYKSFEMTCTGMDTTSSSFGSLSMASLADDSTYYLGWEHVHPYYEIVLRSPKLPNIDDTAGRNHIDKETRKVTTDARLFSSIAVSKNLSNSESFKHTFVMGWNFPNLYALQKEKSDAPRLEGYYYSNFFKNAQDVVFYIKDNMNYLENSTRVFHKNFFDSSINDFVLDQVNSHLNTFVTSAWLTQEMNFGIQEGITPSQSWGPLATIDVSMYGNIMVTALFPELQKASMRAHRRLQLPNGEVNHGIQRNFEMTDANAESVHSRLDLPSQYVIQVLQGYFFTNDKAYLQEMWPSVLMALDYVLRERDHNQDHLPDMEGAMCSYDNFPMYGAASYVASQWLSALCYTIKAAEELGDTEISIKYKEVLQKGKDVFERLLWNGEYYRLYNDAGGKKGDLDEGCLTDQMIGQWSNYLIGAGELFDPERRKKAFTSILQKSYNPEYGLTNCRWPQDGFLHDVDPDCWNDQANTCWSGVELAFASLLIYDGMLEQGLEIVHNVDTRYRKSGMYFDHLEWGGHYYRAMSAWSIINSMLGLSICGDKYSFSPKLPEDSLKLFFAFGTGTAHYIQALSFGEISLHIHSGQFTCTELNFEIRDLPINEISLSRNGQELSSNEYTYCVESGSLHIKFHTPYTINESQMLSIRTFK